MPYESETDIAELDFIKRKADDLGFYVNRHLQFDPTREGGDLYLQPKRKFRGEKQETLLKYATSEECWKFLAEAEKGLHHAR